MIDTSHGPIRWFVSLVLWWTQWWVHGRCQLPPWPLRLWGDLRRVYFPVGNALAMLPISDVAANQHVTSVSCCQSYSSLVNPLTDSLQSSLQALHLKRGATHDERVTDTLQGWDKKRSQGGTLPSDIVLSFQNGGYLEREGLEYYRQGKMKMPPASKCVPHFPSNMLQQS